MVLIFLFVFGFVELFIKLRFCVKVIDFIFEQRSQNCNLGEYFQLSYSYYFVIQWQSLKNLENLKILNYEFLEYIYIYMKFIFCFENDILVEWYIVNFCIIRNVYFKSRLR